MYCSAKESESAIYSSFIGCYSETSNLLIL